MSSIKVKLNAPNWPKMVSKEPSESDAIKAQCVSSSLWLQKRANKKNETKILLNEICAPADDTQLTRFASKSRILRQCTFCQMLYSSFHKCSEGVST